jgi:Polyketide cyclase / dehydrase and lipid transport
MRVLNRAVAAAISDASPIDVLFGGLVMFKKIFLAVLAAIGLFLGYVAIQPNVPITRSATLDAPAAAIFPHINDLHKWQAWSPWAKIDPNAKATFEGPEAGVGAVFNWSSANDEVGEGKMTIIESVPNDHVKIQLDFAKPYAGKSVAVLSLKPEADKTNVTWAMTGDDPGFMVRVICTLMNMDKMVGGMFEKGLASLGEAAKSK